MSMTRADALLYLQHRFTQTFTNAGVSMVAADLDHIIDQALIWQGVAFSSLTTAEVADDDVAGFMALLRYSALKTIYDAVLSFVDIQISDPNVSKNRSQFVKSMENAVKEARDEADPYMATSGAFQTGAIIWSDPACVDEYAAVWPCL